MQDVHLRRHQTAAALKCPRCESLNTKFCYYNNYNLSQPRHFCKHCRRYWTNGGVLRNVPVGGGCRKSNKTKPKPKPKPKQSLSLSSSSADSTTAGGNCGPNGAVLEEVLLAPEIGGFMSNSDPNPGPDLLGFVGSATSYGELLDPTVRIDDDDVVENKGNNGIGGGVALDWQQLADQNVNLGLFDLDDRPNWTQSTTSFQDWSDNISINNNHNHDYFSLSFFLD